MTNFIPGTVVAGRYRIEAQIGSGGLSTVYRALDLRLNRFVVLKVLTFYLANDPEFVHRFQHEIAVATRLDHPNILRVYDFSISENAKYLVMEYVDGGSLQDRIAAAEGPLDPEFALAIIEQIGAALSYAHARGIVHRDIKPSNILIGNNGRALLADFGLARTAESLTGSSMTSVGTILGTPEYMSPEQAQGQPLDARSDIYSLGVVLYQLLTGRTPFQSGFVPATLYQQVHEPPQPLRILNPKISPDLEGVVLKALAKYPDRRFQTVDDFVRAVRTPRVHGSMPMSATILANVPVGSSVQKQRSSMTLPLWIALCSLLIVAVVAAGVWSISGSLLSAPGRIIPFSPTVSLTASPIPSTTPGLQITLTPPPPLMTVVLAVSVEVLPSKIPAMTAVSVEVLPSKIPERSVSGVHILLLILLTLLLLVAIGAWLLIARARRLRSVEPLPNNGDAYSFMGEREVAAAGSIERSQSMITGETFPIRPAETGATQILRQAPDVAAFLLVLNGPQRGQQLKLRGITASIGRSPSINEICIQDSSISRIHARIRLEQDRFTIYDADSANGTFVNGAMISRQELRDRDEIRVGNTNLIFMQVATDTSPEARRRLQEFDGVWDDLTQAVHREQ